YRSLQGSGNGASGRSSPVNPPRGNGRCGGHHHQGRTGNDVTRVGRSSLQSNESYPEQDSYYRTLPQEVDQCPADRLCQRGYLEPPLIRSSSFSIASISFADDFLLASACITRALTEPPKARSSKSRTRCRCVCSCEYLAR